MASLKRTKSPAPAVITDPSVARALRVDLRMLVSANRYVRCDPTTWGAFPRRRTAPAWQLGCLHSDLAPESFGPTGEQAIAQLLRPYPKSKLDLGRLVIAEARGVDIPPEILLAHNLMRIEAAILDGTLATTSPDSLCEPLMRSVRAGVFKLWAEREYLPRVGAWPLRPVADHDWDELVELMPERFVLAEGAEAAVELQDVLPSNVYFDAMFLCKRHWQREYQQRVDRQGRSVIPTRSQIRGFLEASGFRQPGPLATWVSKALTPADTPKGPRATLSPLNE
jgi:hypothetical protein